MFAARNVGLQALGLQGQHRTAHWCQAKKTWSCIAKVWQWARRLASRRRKLFKPKALKALVDALGESQAIGRVGDCIAINWLGLVVQPWWSGRGLVIWRI